MSNNYSNIEIWNDTALIAEYVKTGDNNTVGELFNRYARLVFGVGLKYLKNKDESKDMMLNVFEKLLADLKKHEIIHFKSWLYSYTKNSCLMAMRKQKVNIIEKDVFEISKQTEEAFDVEEKEIKIVALENELHQLSEIQKTCIRLFFIENKSYNEISKITGLNFNHIKSCIQNGKRNLKLRLTQIGINE